jgi:hypothetical protein
MAKINYTEYAYKMLAEAELASNGSNGANASSVSTAA